MNKTTQPEACENLDPRALYETNILPFCPDPPPFSEEIAKYVRYKPHMGEVWRQFTHRIDEEFREALIASDPFSVKYTEDAFSPWPTARLEDEDRAKQIVFECADIARDHYKQAYNNPDLGEIFARLAFLAPRLMLTPKRASDQSADWAWARTRCALGIAGPANQLVLCRALACEPAFPWRTDITEDEYQQELKEAHKLCGWPVSLLVFPLSGLNRLPPPPKNVPIPRWIYWPIVFRILFHTRFDSYTNKIRVTCHGHTVVAEVRPSSNIIGHQRSLTQSIAEALGLHSMSMKSVVSTILSQLVTEDLLPAKQVSQLPSTVIAGRWTSFEPAPRDDWTSLGIRLSGYWSIDPANETVTEGTTDPCTIIGYCWTPSYAAEHPQARERAELSLPAQVVASRPSDLLREVFPNLVFGNPEHRTAAFALLDAVICANLIRSEIPQLAWEFPIVCILPDVPTLVHSVNQGKTSLAFQLAKCLAPSLEGPIAARDNTSSPDNRTIAEEIRLHGTICLDEFTMPSSQTSIVCRQNLATLATGGAVAAGRVFENRTADLRLLHPMVLSAKALDFTEDLISRSIFLYVRQLSPNERARSQVWNILQTSRLAFAMRLNALCLIHQSGMLENIKKIVYSASSSGWRFGIHRAIANLFIDNPKLIDEYIIYQKKRFLEHYYMAEENGVLASMRSARDARISLEQFFADLSPYDIQVLSDLCRRDGISLARGYKCTVNTLWKARCNLLGISSPGQAFSLLTGSDIRVSNRTACVALQTEIEARIDPSYALRLPGLAGQHGWFLWRPADRVVVASLIHVPQEKQDRIIFNEG